MIIGNKYMFVHCTVGLGWVLRTIDELNYYLVVDDIDLRPHPS